MEPESDKEFYDQLGEELNLLLNQLNELELRIQKVTNEKPPQWRKRRWKREQAGRLFTLNTQRTQLSRSIGSLNNQRATSTYGRFLQSENDKAKHSRRQSERDKARNRRRQNEVKTSSSELSKASPHKDSKPQSLIESISGIIGFGLGFVAGLFDPIKSDLTQLDIEQILDGRHASDLAGYYFGEIYSPRVMFWSAGLLAIFNNGSGSIFWVFTKANDQSNHNFHFEKSWGPGNPSNGYNDPTPLLIGPNGVPFEEAKKYLPRSTTPISKGETIMVFENFSNDFDSDGMNSWVSGASHYQGEVFRGTVYGKGLSILRKRCANRKPW